MPVGDDLVPCRIRLTLVPADVSSAVLSPRLPIPRPAAANAVTPCPLRTWKSVCVCHQPVTRQNSPLVVCPHLPSCFSFYPFIPCVSPPIFSSPPLQAELLIIFPLSVSVRLPPLHLADLSSPPSLYLIHTYTHTECRKVLAYISHGVCSAFSSTCSSNVLERGTCCAELIGAGRQIRCLTSADTQRSMFFQTFQCGRRGLIVAPSVNVDIAAAATAAAVQKNPKACTLFFFSISILYMPADKSDRWRSEGGQEKEAKKKTHTL